MEETSGGRPEAGKRAAAAPPLDPARAQPSDLPLRHFAAAAVAFWIFAAAFALRPDRLLGPAFPAEWALGLVQVLGLGWITMTLFGAICQLSAVLWEAPLAWPEAVRWAWWTFLLGLAAFVGELWSGGGRFWIAAVILAGSIGVYLACFARTMIRASRRDWAGRHLAVSLPFLAAAVVLGLLLACDRQRGGIIRDPGGALSAHMHLALIGWVSLTLMGVSYRLVSMSALAHVDCEAPGRLALALAPAGLGGLALDGLFFGGRHLPLWACLLAAAYASYAWQMRRIIPARGRRVDPALAYTLLALAGGAVWAVLGVALSSGLLPGDRHVVAAYLYAALVGWATPFILGQVRKIVPFLVWLNLFGRRTWTPQNPPPKMTELASEKLAWAEFAAMVPAVALGIAGFLRESPPLLRAGSLFLLAAATLYAANTGLCLSFLFRDWSRPEASAPR